MKLGPQAWKYWSLCGFFFFVVSLFDVFSSSHRESSHIKDDSPHPLSFSLPVTSVAPEKPELTSPPSQSIFVGGTTSSEVCVGVSPKTKLVILQI